MQNGTNGHGPAPAPQIQINPQQAAAYALEFLERVNHTRAERERFDIGQALLNAIMNGQVVLAPPPQAVAAVPDKAAQSALDSPP